MIHLNLELVDVLALNPDVFRSETIKNTHSLSITRQVTGSTAITLAVLTSSLRTHIHIPLLGIKHQPAGHQPHSVHWKIYNHR